MLNEPTMSKLYEMKLNGMAEAYEEQRMQSHLGELSLAITPILWTVSGIG